MTQNKSLVELFTEVIAANVSDNRTPLEIRKVAESLAMQLQARSISHTRYTFEFLETALSDHEMIGIMSRYALSAKLCTAWAWHLGAETNLQAFTMALIMGVPRELLKEVGE